MPLPLPPGARVPDRAVWLNGRLVRGHEAAVSVFDRGARAGGAGGGGAILSETPFAPGLLGRHKTTSRLAWDLAREEARAAGADEALLVSPTGEVLEGAASNVFVVRDGGDVVTPPLAADVLP